MKLSDVLDQLPADGATVIPVAKPLGVFLVRGGEASRVPAVDHNRSC